MTETTPSEVSRRSVLSATAWSVPVIAAASAVPVAAATCNDIEEWVTVWEDDFNGPAGTGPNPLNWELQLGSGDNGWGNSELQNYTDSTENAYLDGAGNLVIEAKLQTTTMPDINGNPVTKNYTSARLRTKNKYAPMYGRVEARIHVPTTPGLLPAFWMLGQNHPEQAWPFCGEIDIMELVGSRPGDANSGAFVTHGNMHGPRAGVQQGDPNWWVPFSRGAHFNNGTNWTTGFHRYGIEWEPNSIKFYVDDIVFRTVTPAEYGANPWVYNAPFQILLNVAVGGSWPGNPTGASVFPQRMVVDYVRHQQKMAINPCP